MTEEDQTLSATIPLEVLRVVQDGGSYVYDRTGWHAVSARPAEPGPVNSGNSEVTVLGALRRLDRYFTSYPASTPVREALDFLWEYCMLGKGK